MFLARLPTPRHVAQEQRRVVARELRPEEAVVAYHDDLVAHKFPAVLPLHDDLRISDPALRAED